MFKVGTMFSREIYDKAFYQLILPNAKYFRFLKRGFKALVAKLSPYVLQNPLSPYYLLFFILSASKSKF